MGAVFSLSWHQPLQRGRGITFTQQRASENTVGIEYFLLTRAPGSIMKWMWILMQLSLLLPSLFSLPKLVSKDEQSQLCVLAFYRCCSSTEKLPLRCFEMNRCNINFETLELYNSICRGIYKEEEEPL